MNEAEMDEPLMVTGSQKSHPMEARVNQVPQCAGATPT